MKIAAGSLIIAWTLSTAVEAQGLPPLTDEMLKQASAVLHVDVKTGRLAGITDRGPVAEVGVKVVDVLFGDYKADEWIAYTKPVEGEYVKPAVSQRLLILSRESHRGPLVDADFSAQARDGLVQRLTEHRRNRELLTGEMHVPDYLLRSATNALLHVEVTKTTPYERGRDYLSATHVAKVVGVAQGVVVAARAREPWVHGAGVQDTSGRCGARARSPGREGEGREGGKVVVAVQRKLSVAGFTSAQA